LRSMGPGDLREFASFRASPNGAAAERPLPERPFFWAIHFVPLGQRYARIRPDKGSREDAYPLVNATRCRSGAVKAIFRTS
jgi:hypothetical protein